MIVTYQEEYGNFFGRSRMIPAYESWYWKMVSIQFFLRWMERHSISPYKVLFPKGKTITKAHGEVNNAELALMIAKAVSAYGNVTIPSDRDDNGNLKWDIGNIEQSRQNLTLDKIINVWDMGIVSGFLIPEPSGLSGSQPVSGLQPDSATKIFLSTLGEFVLNCETTINEEIIKPLVMWNFSPSERTECKVNIEDIDFQKREEMRKLYSKILDVSATFLKNTGGLPFKTLPDVDRILEILDIPGMPVVIHEPPTFGPDGKEKKPQDNPLVNKTPGPQKGEPTSGNLATEGPDGTPKDPDKQAAAKGE